MKTSALTIKLAALALTSILALSACGGGGGGTTSQSGTPGAAVSKGVVTAKGSIFVNGIKYTTTGATITIDDNPGTENDIKLGMTVKVRGTSDDATKTGTAIKIEARDALEGEIESVDNVNKTITVMGQIVRIEDNITHLNDDSTIKIFAGAGFAVGNRVEVNGFPDDNGGLRATRVAKKTSSDFEMKGFVVSLGASSFNLALTPGGAAVLTVNFAAGLLPAGMTDGSLVEVKSLTKPVAGAIPTITASRIKLEDSLGENGEKVEVEGIVSSGTLASFIVNGQKVLTTTTTVYEGGLSSDFAVGMKLEAEGQMNANGELVATKIHFRSSIKIEADASNVTTSELTVLGKVVAINNFTRKDTNNGPIANGAHLEVRAMLDRDGKLLATRIIVKNASTKAFLQGPVTLADSLKGTLTILGIEIASDSNTDWRISSDSTELPVGKAEFFARLNLGASIVKAKWDPFTSLTAAIKEAEIELGK